MSRVGPFQKTNGLEQGGSVETCKWEGNMQSSLKV